MGYISSAGCISYNGIHKLYVRQLASMGVNGLNKGVNGRQCVSMGVNGLYKGYIRASMGYIGYAGSPTPFESP